MLNARALSDGLIKRGLRVLTGGTDNHIVVVDLRGFGVTGRDAETALSRCFVVTNKNVLPFDPLPANVASGVRLGVCACTTRGMRYTEMMLISNIVASVLLEKSVMKHVTSKMEAEARAGVLSLADAFPVLYN